MAQTKKRVVRKSKPGKRGNRPRTRGEKIFIVVSILLAISMVVTLFAAFGNGGGSSSGGALSLTPDEVVALATSLIGLV